MIFKSAGQNCLVACEWNKGVVMLYRAYKVLELLPDAVREAKYAAEE